MKSYERRAQVYMAQEALMAVLTDLNIEDLADNAALAMKIIRACNDLLEINRKGYEKWKSDHPAPLTPE